jgi:hypothetical protein
MLNTKTIPCKWCKREYRTFSSQNGHETSMVHEIKFFVKCEGQLLNATKPKLNMLPFEPFSEAYTFM